MQAEFSSQIYVGVYILTKNFIYYELIKEKKRTFWTPKFVCIDAGLRDLLAYTN